MLNLLLFYISFCILYLVIYLHDLTRVVAIQKCCDIDPKKILSISTKMVIIIMKINNTSDMYIIIQNVFVKYIPVIQIHFLDKIAQASIIL